MKYLILYVVFAVMVLFPAFCESETIYTNPVEVYRFVDVSIDDLVEGIDLSINPRHPFCDDTGKWYIPCIDGSLKWYSASFEKMPAIKIDISGFQCTDYFTVRTSVIGTAYSDGIRVTLVNDMLAEKFYPFKADSYYICAIENVVLYQKVDKKEYFSCVLDKTGKCTVMGNNETIEYMINNIDNISIIDGKLYYYNKLIGPNSYDQFDDDGNGYSGLQVYTENGEHISIKGKNKDVQWEEQIDFQIDYEGNLWQVDYSKAEKESDQHPILLYAGRTWGYRDPPKPAVVLDDGLRLRLRANTSAFVLGTLSKNQNITILKTGEKATIGGVTAPWYRVKTEDGLVGWAFGGFIKVTEK